MTEEVKDEVIETPGEETKVVEPSEVEKRAMEMGWRPLSEFDGDEDSFIEAKEFIARRPLFDKIEHQGKQLKATIRALEELKTHYTMVKESEYKRALSDLKLQRKQAMTEGNGDAFEVLDEQIKEVEDQAAEMKTLREQPAVKATPTEPAEFVTWKNKNPWYESTGYMRKFADDYGAQAHNSGLSPSEVLKEVERAVRREFPNKFTNPNKANAPRVEDNNNANRKSSKSETFELTDQERKIMNDFVRQKVMTKEEYIESLKQVRGT